MNSGCIDKLLTFFLSEHLTDHQVYLNTGRDIVLKLKESAISDTLVIYLAKIPTTK